MIEIITQYLDLIVTILISLATIIGLLGKLFKNEKIIKLSKKIEVYTELVKKYVVVAENIKDLSGKEKLNYVIEQVSLELRKLNIEVDADLIKKLVENIIELSKDVNFKK